MSQSPADALQNAQLTGTIYNEFTVTTRDGKPARLAIIDAGTAVARECWQIAINVHTNFLRGTGHIIVHSTPPGLPLKQKEAA